MQHKTTRLNLSTSHLIAAIGQACFVLGVSTVLFSVLAYVPSHPDFSLLTTYLSDIGDTQGWPQILFNSGTLLAAPLRYLMILLVWLWLRERGTSRGLMIAGVVVGFFSTAGTVMMTATPFSVAPTIHKSGIGLYFFGVVILQTLFIIAERRVKAPVLLPALSAAVIFFYCLFTVLVVLYETGSVGRNSPVLWEWMCFFTSMAWLAAHTILLGRDRSRANVLMPVKA